MFGKFIALIKYTVFALKCVSIKEKYQTNTQNVSGETENDTKNILHGKKKLFFHLRTTK